MRLLVEAAARHRPVLRGPQHRLRLAVQHLPFVLDAKGIDIGPARAAVESVDAAGAGGEGPRAAANVARKRTADVRSPLEPEVNGGLLAVQIEIEQLVGCSGPSRAVDVVDRLLGPAELVRSPGGLEECHRLAEAVGPALGDLQPALACLVMAAELGRERGDFRVQLDGVVVRRRSVVGDLREQPEAFLSEQRPRRRAGEAVGEPHCRKAAGPPVLERLAEEPHIVSRLTFQPLGDSTLESSSRRPRQVAHSGLADQVVGDPQRRSGVQHDAPVDQLRRRELDPVVRPAHHGACVFDAQWPSGKGEDGKERHRVGAGPAQARREKPSGVRVVAGGLRERLEPERRPACLLPYLCCRSVIQRRRHLAHQLDALLPPQTADLERDDPLWRQCLLQPAQELSAASRRPCSGEDRQRLIGVAGGAHEVMAQSERALVHPLEIVDHQERRLERPGSPMSGLEDPHRLERRGPRRRIEEDCLQPFAVARALREPSEESRRRRERDLAFGLVADDAEPIRNVDTPRGLREEPALADTGIPDDERRHRPADRGARDGLDKRLELGGPAHERPGHGSSVDRSEPLRTHNGAQRSPNRLDLDPEVLHSETASRRSSRQTGTAAGGRSPVASAGLSGQSGRATPAPSVQRRPP